MISSFWTRHFHEPWYCKLCPCVFFPQPPEIIVFKANVWSFLLSKSLIQLYNYNWIKSKHLIILILYMLLFNQSRERTFHVVTSLNKVLKVQSQFEKHSIVCLSILNIASITQPIASVWVFIDQQRGPFRNQFKKSCGKCRFKSDHTITFFIQLYP